LSWWVQLPPSEMKYFVPYSLLNYFNDFKFMKNPMKYVEYATPKKLTEQTEKL